MPCFSGDPLDNGLAYDFALAVYNQLGTNSYPPFPGSGGPLFAYAVDGSSVFAVFQDANDLAIQNEIQVSLSQIYNFAYLKSTPPTSSAPGPLPLMGVAASFHWSRTLRRRIRGHRSTGLSPLPPPSLRAVAGAPARRAGR